MIKLRKKNFMTHRSENGIKHGVVPSRQHCDADYQSDAEEQNARENTFVHLAVEPAARGLLFRGDGRLLSFTRGAV